MPLLAPLLTALSMLAKNTSGDKSNENELTIHLNNIPPIGTTTSISGYINGTLPTNAKNGMCFCLCLYIYLYI